MQALTYDVAMAMGNLTNEQLQEQTLWAMWDCRTDDMINYCNLLIARGIELPQEAHFGAIVTTYFINQFDPNFFYPTIQNYILNGNHVFDQMCALFLVLFYRFKDRCYNFSVDEHVRIPYESPIPSDKVDAFIETLEKYYEKNSELKMELKNAGVTEKEMEKLDALFYKLMILVYDLKLKAVSYSLGYTGGGPSGIYDVDFQKDMFGTSKAVISERQKEIYEHFYIASYSSVTKYDERQREFYGEKLRKLGVDYPLYINTWEGYGIDFEAVERFVGQFGIPLTDYNLGFEAYLLGESAASRSKEDAERLENFYERFGKSRINPNDRMAALFVKTDEDKKLEKTDTSILELGIEMFIMIFKVTIPVAIIGSLLTKIFPFEGTDLIGMGMYYIILIVMEIRVYRKFKRTSKQKNEFSGKRLQEQMEYIQSLYKGTLPLL